MRRLACQVAKHGSQHAQILTAASRRVNPSWACQGSRTSAYLTTTRSQLFSTSPVRQDDSKWDKKARELHQRGVDEEEQEVRARQAQIKRPWLREDADKPPVQEKEKPPLTKGILTAPTCQLLRCPTANSLTRQTVDHTDATFETHPSPPSKRREGQKQ